MTDPVTSPQGLLAARTLSHPKDPLLMFSPAELALTNAIHAEDCAEGETHGDWPLWHLPEAQGVIDLLASQGWALARIGEAEAPESEMTPNGERDWSSIAKWWQAEAWRFAGEAEALRAAAQAYIDWRDQRLAQWRAVAECGHSDPFCPEMEVIRSTPLDHDEKLDDAIRAALSTRATGGAGA